MLSPFLRRCRRKKQKFKPADRKKKKKKKKEILLLQHIEPRGESKDTLEC